MNFLRSYGKAVFFDDFRYGACVESVFGTV